VRMCGIIGIYKSEARLPPGAPQGQSYVPVVGGCASGKHCLARFCTARRPASAVPHAARAPRLAPGRCACVPQQRPAARPAPLPRPPRRFTPGLRAGRQGAVSPELFEGLLMLQHRGQDSAGMVTTSGRKFFEHKDNGLVNDVFSKRTMSKLEGATTCSQRTVSSSRVWRVFPERTISKLEGAALSSERTMSELKGAGFTSKRKHTKSKLTRVRRLPSAIPPYQERCPQRGDASVGPAQCGASMADPRHRLRPARRRRWARAAHWRPAPRQRPPAAPLTAAARAARRQRGHRPRALPDGRQRVGPGGAALLCQLAARRLPHPQRQPDQRGRAP